MICIDLIITKLPIVTIIFLVFTTQVFARQGRQVVGAVKNIVGIAKIKLPPEIYFNNNMG
ncbi:hypothetical protein FHS10_005530 [Mucilaginibacter dorajii]|uniref:Uncharacterized protein n=1 Tax=Mucilaginibacter dorajii TaxID=692994 RepID=A0ABP7PQV1_9SPHI|nr:hypothetical protein [Mucilaginibacter dorajii]